MSHESRHHPEALAELRLGRPVIVVDNESRENEGDVVIAAELASQEWIAWTVKNSSGFICAPMTNEIADRLDLPVMVANNEDDRGTNYTVSVDAANRLSTGISAADRAHTLRVLADLDSTPASLHRPVTSCRCARWRAACASATATPRPPSTSSPSRG